MPNEVVVVETPEYQTRTEYGIRSSLDEIVPSNEPKRLKDIKQPPASSHGSALHTLASKREPGPQRKHGNIPL